MRKPCFALLLALVAPAAAAPDTLIWIAARDALVGIDMTGAERTRHATPGLPGDLLATADGLIMLNDRQAQRVLVVDAMTGAERASLPTNRLGGSNGTHAYLTPLLGGRQFHVAVMDGQEARTPAGQRPQDSTAMFTDVTPASATRLQAVGEVRLGIGHHKLAFSARLPRFVASNIGDCEVVLGLYDFTDPAAIRRIAAMGPAALGLDGSSAERRCDASRANGVRPAPHGTATAPLNGLVFHNMNGTGQFVAVDPDAAQPQWQLLSTRGWGGAAIAAHAQGRFLYGSQFAPRVGDARAPGLPCQVGQIAVLDAATPAIAAEVPVLADGPDCTRNLAGTPEAHARTGYAVVPSGSNLLFLPLSTLGPPSGRAHHVVVFDVSDAARPRQLPSIPVGAHSGHRDLAVSGDGALLIVPNNQDGTISVIDIARRSVAVTLPAPAMPVRIASFSPTRGPSLPTGPVTLIRTQ